MQPKAVVNVGIVKVLLPRLIVHNAYIKAVALTPKVGAVNEALQLRRELLPDNAHRRNWPARGKAQLKPHRSEPRDGKLTVKLGHNLPDFLKGSAEQVAFAFGLPEAGQFGLGIFLHKGLGKRQHAHKRNGGKSALCLSLPDGIFQNVVHECAV